MDYIRGLVEGEGCFSFCSVPTINKKTRNRLKIPTFVIQMNIRDHALIEGVRDCLKLKDKVYTLKPYLLDGFNRGKTARLMVRDFGELRNIIIPLFYKKFVGYKGQQLIQWLDNIGHDPDVHPNYKVLYILYKSGHFEK